MSFELRSQPPVGYYHHNSSGEHALKHSADPSGIVRLQEEVGHEVLQEGAVYDLMENAGVVTVRSYHEDGGIGDIAGFAVAEHVIDNDGFRVVKVEDMFVQEPHRAKGIGGFMLGWLVADSTPFNAPHAHVLTRYHHDRLQLDDAEYRLPGLHVIGSEYQMDKEAKQRFKQSVPLNWNGIQSLGSEHVVFRDGEIVALLHDMRGGVTIEGHDEKTYANEVFAAIDVLNDRL